MAKSFAFWPSRRAKRVLPRIRHWANVAEPSFLGLVAFKAGMTHVTMVDDSAAPTKGSEIAVPVTILEVPKIHIYGIRFYSKDVYKHAILEVYDKQLAKNIGIKETNNTDLQAAKSRASEFIDVSALAYLDPAATGNDIKKLERYEVPIGGKSVEEKLSFLEKWLGKETTAADLVKAGEFVDVTSISKGKGWEGPVKKFGIAQQRRKATGRRRHVGTLGPCHPPSVLFSVPMAGHLGYNYRTELNKRVLKVGSQGDVAAINVKGGFLHYGIVKSSYLMLKGSLPGVPKRLVRIRKSMRKPKPSNAPEIRYISLASKQGA